MFLARIILDKKPKSYTFYFNFSSSISLMSRLRVFENRVLRVFGLKRDEVTGEWRKLHIEELNDLFPYPILCGW
jgi:hypothetical protein